jgi:hypothetical protein
VTNGLRTISSSGVPCGTSLEASSGMRICMLGGTGDMLPEMSETPRGICGCGVLKHGLVIEKDWKLFVRVGLLSSHSDTTSG